jgi:hypothetical protein
MISYEVTVDVEPALVVAYIEYMQGRHISEVLATGCFVAAEFQRTGPGRFRQRYRSRDQASLDRYLADYAPALRLDFQQHFPAGIGIFREVWQDLGRWDAESGR